MAIFSADFLQNIKNLLRGILGTKQITTQITLQVKGVNMNAIELEVGQSVIVTIIPERADNSPSGGTVTEQDVEFNNPTDLASITMNADGTATVAGLKPSMGTIQGTAHATVTDTDGFVSHLAMMFTVTVDPDPNFADRTTTLDLEVKNPA